MKKIISEYQKKIAFRLSEISLNWDECYQLKNSINYTLLNCGKLIRSVIFLLGLNDLEIDSNQYIDVACAIEMIQSYTLIHDDLPEMDNATMRRDKIANHLMYGHSIALLAGDALLTDTFLVLSNLKISDTQKVALINLFAQKAGTSGVCYGQTLDIMNQKNGFSNWSEIESMIKYKTCSLFELSFQAIGLLASLNDEKLAKLLELGYLYGLAFQIQDDLNDDILVDDINLIDKKTYHQIFGKEKALEKINQLLSQIEKLCIIVFGEKNKIFAYLKSTFK
mgnify:CR=1 FL=1|jgi:geranyltranstransferase